MVQFHLYEIRSRTHFQDHSFCLEYRISQQDFKGVDVHFVIEFNYSVDSRLKLTSILEYVFTQLVLEKEWKELESLTYGGWTSSQLVPTNRKTGIEIQEWSSLIFKAESAVISSQPIENQGLKYRKNPVQYLITEIYWI